MAFSEISNSLYESMSRCFFEKSLADLIEKEEGSLLRLKIFTGGNRMLLSNGNSHSIEKRFSHFEISLHVRKDEMSRSLLLLSRSCAGLCYVIDMNTFTDIRIFDHVRQFGNINSENLWPEVRCFELIKTSQ